MILYKTVFQWQRKCIVLQILIHPYPYFTVLKSTILSPEDCVKSAYVHHKDFLRTESHVQGAFELLR